MKKSTKAACLSLFVFPGAGLLWLKRYIRGLLFFVPALLSFFYVIVIIFKVTLGVRDKYALMLQENPEIITNGDLMSLAMKMYKDVFAQLGTQMSTLNFLEYFFIACWLCSALSSYFVGLQIETQAAQTATTQKQ